MGGVSRKAFALPVKEKDELVLFPCPTSTLKDGDLVPGGGGGSHTVGRRLLATRVGQWNRRVGSRHPPGRLPSRLLRPENEPFALRSRKIGVSVA